MGSSQSFPKLSKEETKIFLDGGYSEIPYKVPKDNKIQIINASCNKIQKLPQNLSNLEILVLSENGYVEVPQQVVEVISTCPLLRMICLSFNKLTSLPHSILMLKSLRWLELMQNKIEHIDFGLLDIESVDISSNYLNRLPLFPSTLTNFNVDYNYVQNVKINLPNLTRFSIKMNKVSNFIFKQSAPSLTRIDISMNDLQELPNFEEYCPALEILDVSNNYIKTFPKLPISITELYIYDNLIEEIPEEISNLECLSKLDAHENKIKKIPKLPHSLTSLELYENEIEEIEDDELPNLFLANLVRNKIKVFPKMLKNVPKCYIFNNEISEIPNENLGDKLSFINFAKNSLTDIPRSLLNYKNMSQVHFQSNKIKKFPEEFKSMAPEFLGLSLNPLESVDNVPTTPKVLAMGYCGINSLPTIELFKSLEVVHFPGNSLTEFPFIPLLKEAYLSRNKIKQFPKFPENMEVIDLSFNEIADTAELYFPILEDLDISHNRISQLSNISLPKVVSLKISDNPIAQTLVYGQFPLLENVDISNTKVKFSEKVPDSIREIISSVGEPSIQRKVFPKCQWVGVSEMKGIRPTQEDAVICYPFAPNGIHIFSVLDGHGGSKTSNFAACDLFNNLSKLEKVDENTLSGSVSATLKSLKAQHFNDGSTMALAVITPNRHIFSCHLGDSRTIVVRRDGSISHFTKDHKPDEKSEVKRVLSQHGFILKHRVMGLLAVSSSLGDFEVVGIGHQPVIREWVIDESDKWLVICCDGVFDVLTNEEVGKICQNATSASALAYDIKNIAFELLSQDNISCIAVDLENMAFSN
ncbi:protein phosphatase 2C, putative [Trichomonas vaginalis G3]|uniref:Protein phosphatase 2C, putative n=1 Tax=Trichomonas vaginalis (strain ATCC PRA-98 / G3) TaxID=412133 RepID=A2EQP7_TRIV3|nr:protein phosphatase 2C, putative [Trichomonas vaginalis G3]|eukprot:XP_001317235.1 protein phosphatase 2C [Trichomonas vaginalis G3]